MSEADARERKGSPLLTRRLRLRPFRAIDVAGLALIAASDAVRQNLTIALDRVGAARDSAAFMVERRKDRVPIGAGGYRAAEGGTVVEFALFIAEDDWGRGYGTEVAHALIDHAFAERQVMEVCAAVRVTNVRGRGLIEKCGFQPRGTGMARAAYGAFPAERFVLSRRTWISLKDWGAHYDDTRTAPRSASA